MNPVRVLLKKELLESLRDRRTLAMMLLVPMLLYPTLLALVGALMASGKERLAREELTVAVASPDAQAFLVAQSPPAHTTWTPMERTQAERALKDKRVSAIVDAPEGAHQAMRQGEQALVTIVYTKRHDRSIEALERVRRVLKKTRETALRVRLAEASLPETFAEPVRVDELDLDFRKDLGPLIASRLLPVLLIVMLFVGALYPAIDVIAGEKERGTLETLLVAPVRPTQIMTAKYLSVAVIASAAALMNLGAMGATFAFGFTLDEGTRVKLQFSAAQLATLVLCLVPSAFMASAIALAVASLARSFKQAQNLLTPVTVVATVPGLVTMMPGIELNALTAAVPLLNIALLVKATVLGTAEPLHVAITLASVAACAAVAIALAARAFNSERLRF